MTTDLSGRVALVTGGAVGLGRAFVEELAGRGARVTFTFTSSDEAAGRLAAAFPEGRVVPVRADVTSDDEVRAAVEAAVAPTGRLDLLVNNAGTTRWIPAADLAAVDDEDWHRLLDVNLVGAFRCVRAAWPSLREAGGSILNVASNSAFSGSGSSIPYVVSKAGVVSLTRVLARTLAPRVRVNAVAPGWMDTPWLDRHLPDDVAGRLREDRPFVEVADVARIGVDLMLNEAASGEVVVLDRGEVLGASRHEPPTV